MEQQLNDIANLEDIKLLVDTFYSKVKVDLLIGPVFTGVIKDKWPQHLEKMYRFWQTVLLDDHTYTGSPFPPHAQLPVNKVHFDAWIHLWKTTIEEHFNGPKATEAKSRSEKMADMFLSKIQYYQSRSIKPLI